MKYFSAFVLFCFFSYSGFGQSAKTKNVIVITMDGLRWQEVFNGADSTLSFDSTARYNAGYVREYYWAENATARREKLMPFFWSVIKSKGGLYGNRKYNNLVNNANPYWFSYPGYNEIFTGFPDTAVNSNDKVPNPNETVFEYLNKQPAFKGKAAVVASWDVFSSIFNEKRSQLFVNDGFRDVPGKVTEKQAMFNKLQHELPDLFHGPVERLDVATFNIGFEYMKVNKPRLMYFGFGDTDEFAHAGLYDYYLDACHKTDQWIREIWNYVQKDPFYAGNTTIIITTDHGRGAAANGQWTSHGAKVNGAGEIWMAAIGAGVPNTGEAQNQSQWYQGQIAATVAALLGTEFKPSHKTLPAISFQKK